MFRVPQISCRARAKSYRAGVRAEPLIGTAVCVSLCVASPRAAIDWKTDARGGRAFGAHFMAARRSTAVALDPAPWPHPF